MVDLHTFRAVNIKFCNALLAKLWCSLEFGALTAAGTSAHLTLMTSLPCPSLRPQALYVVFLPL